MSPSALPGLTRATVPAGGIRRAASRAFAAICACLGIAMLLAGCTRPYPIPVSGDARNAPIGRFDGLSDLLDRSGSLRVMWAHGMCRHDAGWAAKRAALVGHALDSRWKYLGSTPVNGATLESYEFDVRGRRLEINFLVWSPLIEAYRAKLRFDAPTSEPFGQFEYERAALNGQLKTTLMNQCLIDAVVYSGRNGTPIRRAMTAALCRFLDGRTDPARDACSLGVATGAGRRAYALVAESLGSKLLFDGALAMMTQVNAASLDAHLAELQAVYLISNQIPLLDQANPVPVPPGVDAESFAQDSGGPSSLAAFIALATRGAAAKQRPRPIDVVAFTDPSDLLSYRIPQYYLAGWPVRLANVIVSNADTYLGYVERPDFAHCDYGKNPGVVGLVVKGYAGAGPVPTVEGLTGDPGCLGQ